jgi:hypothetical protein
MAFYFQLFWLPALASAGLLAMSWAGGLQRLSFFVTWFLLAVALQYLAPGTAVWILGLTVQSILAVLLAVRLRLSGL